MSIRLLAQELYRLKKELERLEKELLQAPFEKQDELKNLIIKIKAEHDRMRHNLDGRIDRTRSKR